MKIDGHQMLQRVLLEKAGYQSIFHAVAEMTVFSHPATVYQTKNQNIFRIIRDAPRRGIIAFELNAMYDDNNGPARAFEWAIEGKFDWKDVQFNHIYSDSQNVKLYTSLANLCVTPAFLAKLTDTDPAVVQMLKYRAYDLYGFVPEGEAVPKKPGFYDLLKWHAFPDPVQNVEVCFRERMKTCPKNRASISAKELGWLYSKFKPDASL